MFHDVAHKLVSTTPGHEAIAFPLPRNEERSVALRKLLEAKDAAVRAAMG